MFAERTPYSAAPPVTNYYYESVPNYYPDYDYGYPFGFYGGIGIFGGDFDNHNRGFDRRSGFRGNPAGHGSSAFRGSAGGAGGMSSHSGGGGRR